MVRTLGRECRGWAQGRTETAVQQLIEEHSRRDDPIIYTDGSVMKWCVSVCRFGKRVCAEESGAYNETSSMNMEIEAATAAIQWLVRNDYAHSVIVTDSMSMLAKVERNLLRLEWRQALILSKIAK